MRSSQNDLGNLVADEPRSSIGEGITSSPCRECRHFKNDIPRVICREYDDCLLNKAQHTPPEPTHETKPKPEAIEKIKCKECGDTYPHTEDFFQRNRHGLMKICRACLKKKQAAGRSVYKPRKQPKKFPPLNVKPKQELDPMPKQKPSRIRKKINAREIEFGNEYADLMNDVERYAKEDIRTFREEIIFILSTYRNGRESDGQSQAG